MSGFSSKELAERDATTLPTRERGDVGVRGREAQRVHGALHDAIELPAVGSFDLVLEDGVLLEQGLHVGRVFPELHADLFEARG